MKIAIGMIVRNLISAHPLTDFLDNAEKYDHPIERNRSIIPRTGKEKSLENGARKV